MRKRIEDQSRNQCKLDMYNICFALGSRRYAIADVLWIQNKIWYFLLCVNKKRQIAHTTVFFGQAIKAVASITAQLN